MLTRKAREVLEALQREGILERLILVGSWCVHFYAAYFGRRKHILAIKTLDMDFLIPNPRSVSKPKQDVEELLRPLDFEPAFTASGWLRFVHPDLRVEFLVPRKGPTADEPVKVAALKIVAMPLRHTDALTKHVVTIEHDGFAVKVPHPVAFALHKLFVSKRRKDKGKAARDRAQAFRILELALRSGEGGMPNGSGHPLPRRSGRISSRPFLHTNEST